MIRELLKAFFLIFTAEMGDKTQIIAMTFATQYKIRDVLAGVTIGVLLNHGIAILLGSFIASVIPMNLIQIIAGFLFVIFGINALSNGKEEEIENKKAISPIYTVGLAFFIGELGDKTQLTAMTLSAEASYPLIILLGTTLGMIATSGIGIFIGSKIGNKIPEVFIKIASSFIFLFFGILKLFTTLPEIYLTTINISIFLISVSFIEFTLINRLIWMRKLQGNTSPLKEASHNLYNQTQALKESLDSICLGTEKCGTCSGTGCLIGYTKFVLKDAREKEDYYNSININTDKLIKKEYENDKIIEALILIIRDYEKYGWDFNKDFVINKIKISLEIYLLGHKIENVNNITDYINKVNLFDAKIGKTMKRRLI